MNSANADDRNEGTNKQTVCSQIFSNHYLLLCCVQPIQCCFQKENGMNHGMNDSSRILKEDIKACKQNHDTVARERFCLIEPALALKKSFALPYKICFLWALEHVGLHLYDSCKILDSSYKYPKEDTFFVDYTTTFLTRL